MILRFYENLLFCANDSGKPEIFMNSFVCDKNYIKLGKKIQYSEQTPSVQTCNLKRNLNSCSGFFLPLKNFFLGVLSPYFTSTNIRHWLWEKGSWSRPPFCCSITAPWGTLSESTIPILDVIVSCWSAEYLNFGIQLYVLTLTTLLTFTGHSIYPYKSGYKETVMFPSLWRKPGFVPLGKKISNQACCCLCGRKLNSVQGLLKLISELQR